MKILLAIIFLIYSCTHREILTEKTETLNSDYFSALTIGYRNLAQWEENKYDWQEADHFAKKGLKAERHIMVALEDPVKRDIKDHQLLEELLHYRLEYLTLVTNELKIKFALETANLQILYDSWVEQAEENPDDKRTMRFRKEFIEGFKQLRKSVEILNEEKIKEVELKDKNIYVIYFDSNKYNIDFVASKELNNLIYYLEKLDDYKLVIEGHTDKTGSVKNNLVLSRLRLNIVKSFLINKGVDEKNIIKETTYGEAKQYLKGDSNRSDRQNRRVEIYVITNFNLN